MQTTQQNSNLITDHKNSTPEAQLLVIEREFHVPVDQLFAAFATADALKNWWWPKGLYADRIDYNFREGGHYFINMKGYDQGGGGMTGEFEEIIKNHRIVMTDHFANERGKPISAQEAKMPGIWPAVIYITFDFQAINDHTTRFTLSQEGIPNEVQKDCLQGWNESFDKLEKYLNGRKN